MVIYFLREIGKRQLSSLVSSSALVFHAQTGSRLTSRPEGLVSRQSMWNWHIGYQSLCIHFIISCIQNKVYVAYFILSSRPGRGR